MIKKDFKIGWPQFTLSTRDAAVVIHPTHPSPVWMKQVRMIGFKYCSRQREKKKRRKEKKKKKKKEQRKKTKEKEKEIQPRSLRM